MPAEYPRYVDPDDYTFIQSTAFLHRNRVGNADSAFVNDDCRCYPQKTVDPDYPTMQPCELQSPANLPNFSHSVAANQPVPFPKWTNGAPGFPDLVARCPVLQNGQSPGGGNCNDPNGGDANMVHLTEWTQELRKRYWRVYEALQWGCNEPECWRDGYPVGEWVTLPNGDSWFLSKKKKWNGSTVVLNGELMSAWGPTGYEIHHIFEQQYGYDNSWNNLVPLRARVPGTENKHAPFTAWWQATTVLLRTYEFYGSDGPDNERNPNRPNFVPPRPRSASLITRKIPRRCQTRPI